MSQPAPATQQTIRQHNRGLVLAAIAETPGRSRAQVAAATGLTRATVSALVDDLIAARLVVESAPAGGTRGRPGSPLRLDPDGPAGLGIEVNVDYLAACVVDLTGTVRARRVEQVDNRAAPPRATVRRVARLARAVRAESGLHAAGAGLAVPALVDGDGVLGRVPNLPGWQGFPVVDALGTMLALPVRVGNEANLAALAEHWYGGAPADFVHVSGEIGVGGGLVLGGELFRGVHGYAGELGHVSVDPDGPPCGCGGRGCLEQVAGQAALLRSARVATEQELAEAAAAGGARARTALRRAGEALGVALAGVVNVVDVPAVVLGGVYARLGRWLVPPLCAQLDRRVVSGVAVDVRVSALGTDAAVRGAAGTVVTAIRAGADGAGPTRSSSP